MSVRPMDRADIPAVQAVERSAGELFRSIPEPRIAACADHEPTAAPELEELVADGRAWVADDDDGDGDGDGGEVVGFLAVRIVGGCAHVEEVSVAPAFGGRGHGTALLERAAAWALEQGLPAVTLTTFGDVPWNRPLYERRGFRVLGDDVRTPVLDDLLREEDERYGLARDLRVAMRRDVGAAADGQTARAVTDQA